MSDEDLIGLANDLEPESSALVIVWENTWASRLASAIRGSGGELVSYFRIPREAVVEAILDLEEE